LDADLPGDTVHALARNKEPMRVYPTANDSFARFLEELAALSGPKTR